jgi:hypothetical protein
MSTCATRYITEGNGNAESTGKMGFWGWRTASRRACGTKFVTGLLMQEVIGANRVVMGPPSNDT